MFDVHDLWPVAPSPRVLYVGKRGDWIVTRWVTPSSRGLSTDTDFGKHGCECTWSVSVWCLCLYVFCCELRYVRLQSTTSRGSFCAAFHWHFCLHFLLVQLSCICRVCGVSADWANGILAGLGMGSLCRQSKYIEGVRLMCVCTVVCGYVIIACV